jgi:hypothetical protein
LPLLSGLPAIFQVFLGVLTSFPHEGHLAIMIPFQPLHGISIKHFPSKELKIGQIMPLPAALQPKTTYASVTNEQKWSTV